MMHVRTGTFEANFAMDDRAFECIIATTYYLFEFLSHFFSFFFRKRFIIKKKKKKNEAYANELVMTPNGFEECQ